MKRLKKTLSKLFEEGKQFLKETKLNEKVLLLYHTDADGICSAALTLIGLNKLRIKVYKKFFISEINKISSKIKNKMERSDKIIVVDIPSEMMKNLPTKRKILFFDHHPIAETIKKNIVFINPRLAKKNIYQPTSYILYTFFSKITDMKDYEWVAVLGTVADYGYEDCKDLLRGNVKVKKREKLKQSKIGKITDKFNSAISSFGSGEALKILMSLNSLSELEKNEKINRAHENFINELNKSKNEFWKNAEIYRDKKLIFSVINHTRSRIGSSLATVIAEKKPEYTIIVVEKKKDEFKVHARNHSGKTDVGKLMKVCCEGGGHEQAAGGEVKDLKKFKNKILKNIRNFSRQ